MWALRAAVAVILFVLAGSAGSASAANPALNVDFGLGRESLTRTTTVTLTRSSAGAGTALSAPAVRLVGDLVQDKDQFPANQITLSAVAAGGDDVRVTAVVEPSSPEPVNDGEYVGSAVVGADGFANTTLPVKVSLDDHGAWPHWAKAFLVLLLGAVFGTVAKWLNDTGLALNPLRRRLRELRTGLRGSLRSLPPCYAHLLTNADRAIRAGDVAAATAGVEALENNRDTAVETGGSLQSLDRLRKAHRGLAKKNGVDGLMDVGRMLDAEDEAYQALRRTSVARLSATRDKATTQVVRFRLAGEALALVRPASTPPKVDKVLARLIADDVPGATAAWAAITEKERQGWAGVPVTPVRPVTGDDPAAVSDAAKPSPPRPRQKRRAIRQWVGTMPNFFIDHVRWLVGGLLVLATVVLGYDQRYLGDPGFKGDERQYIGLFLFAAAIPLSGLQVAQLLGKLWPAGVTVRPANPSTGGGTPQGNA